MDYETRIYTCFRIISYCVLYCQIIFANATVIDIIKYLLLS